MAADSAALDQQETALFAPRQSDVTGQVLKPSQTQTPEAVASRAWGGHATDIRLSIPLLTKRYYLVLLAGEERRSKDRRRQERTSHPLSTLGNLAGLIALTSLGTLVGSLLWTFAFIWFLSR